MNKRIQGIIIGLLLGIVIAGTTVFAANTISLHNVLAEGVTIVVDGKKIVPKGVNGKVVEPMIYNGTTYLPVRAVANAFGKAVYWDGPTYTVYLGDMDGKLEYPTAELKDLTSIADEGSIATEPIDNYGNTYSYALRGGVSSFGIGSIYTYEYLTNMKYSRLKGTFYVNEGTTNNGTGKFEVIADGRRIYTSPTMDKTSAPVPLDINITGYNDIKIVFSGNLAYDLRIADAGFYQ